MALVSRFRRYRRNPMNGQARPLSADAEIAFILARYDHGAIPHAIQAVIAGLRLRATDQPSCEHALIAGADMCE
jgi:hypothetical protein